MQKPASPEDVMVAARLVQDGIIAKPKMMLVLAKQRELLERGHSLSVGEICRRKGWISTTELTWLGSLDVPPPDLLPGFQLGRKLGEGGMSRVYRAHDLDLRRDVALKILHPRLRRSEASLQTFRVEAELLISLEHENIVRGHALQEIDGLVLLIMELVDGRSVQEHLDAAGTFSEDAALYIILQVARALTYLHEQGLVHRDIKPGNILIDGQNTVKICDLGLATQSGSGGGETTAGTVHYLAPEQAAGEASLDVRSDIYALGVTLYQLVVGQLPFEGETDQETMAQRLLDELRSPELKRLNISPHLHYFIQKMMAMERDIRYQSPSELIADIEGQIQGKKTLTAQPGRRGPSTLELERPFSAGSPQVVRKAPIPGTKKGMPQKRRRR